MPFDPAWTICAVSFAMTYLFLVFSNLRRLTPTSMRRSCQFLQRPPLQLRKSHQLPIPFPAPRALSGVLLRSLQPRALSNPPRRLRLLCSAVQVRNCCKELIIWPQSSRVKTLRAGSLWKFLCL